ncbi:MAG: glutamylcysteine synthetase, partial [Oscillospiraceae bacterium]|nr:glutamylcysteine synthetase [Oscillospiraceae bacterium]
MRNMNDILAQAIYQKYIVPTERKPQKYLGVELEYPLVNLSRKPVNVPAVQEIVQDFVTEFAFTKQSRDDNGNLYSATEPASGDNLSFDCSFNTIEFSFGKEESIAVLHKRFAAYYDYLQPRLREIGHLMTGMGIHPFYLYNENVPIANDRYRMLFHHLESYSAYESPLFHRFPNFGMFAAASQVQLDVQKNDIIKTLNTMNLLEPYKALLFANSFFERLPELVVSRDYLWRYSTQGYNPHNLGMYDTVFHDLD